MKQNFKLVNEDEKAHFHSITGIMSSDADGLFFFAIQSGSEISNEWIDEKMEVSGPNYTASIPEAEYGESVFYYVVAFDYFNQSAAMGNATNPLSYEIIDTDVPSFNVAGPPSDQPINGTVPFSITASDEGSGVASIVVSIDGEVLEEVIDTAQVSFNWDTTTVENGDYIMTIEVTDGASNTASAEIEYTISNPVGIGGFLAGFAAFMAQYGFFVGIGVAFAIVGVLVFLLRRRRGF